MNTRYTPLLGVTYDFWMIILGMFIISTISVIIFKRKNWL
jgi:Mg2+ and Co2+ transporter CorA